MTRRGGAGPRLARLLVAVAARIVGARRRSEWLREWEAELWVASERGRPVLRHALGAFRHAFSVRRLASFERPAAGARMLEHIRFSWLDVKLGLRMLTKYPGLSSVSVIGMSVAIAIGVGAFSVVASVMDTTLPLPEGDRVVALRNAIITEPGRNRASLRDFVAWRNELKSVQDLSAFATVSRNLVIPGGGVNLVRVARMTASGFRLARTAPVQGRPLLEEDERSDARVVVIAFEEWQRRFAADPGIIGRRVGLGSDDYTVVGVMPEGFRFPVAHRYWIPLAVGPAELERPDAVSLTIFGRLAEEATFESAQAELGTIGARMAETYPGTHERLRPRVLPYTRAFLGMSDAEIWALLRLRLFLGLLLVVVAVNVAILVYARTATRVGEIAVRTALGASRARVVTQLFAEALVLSVTAALIGLTIAGVPLAKLQALVATRILGELPFWVDPGLSPAATTYAVVLAVGGAVIVGVVPALKATGWRVHTSLQQVSGRGGRIELGRAWTVLIVAQVAVAVAVLPFVVHVTEEVIGEGVQDAGYPAAEFLEASLAMQRADGPQDTSAAGQRAREQRFSARAAELIRRLESDPAVVGLTIRIPGDRERIEIEDIASPGADQGTAAAGTRRISRVEPGFFALYGMPTLTGRSFTEADARAGPGVVIVNQVLAEDRLGGGAVLGRRLRFVRQADDTGEVDAGPWLEIVGVVRDFEADKYEPSGNIYLPADVARPSPPISLAVRVRVHPAIGFAPRLREIAAAVDPALQLDGLVSAAERHRQRRQAARYFAVGITAAMLSVLLLSAAGIYAMMSFTVARRRREIGIRSALGADPRRLLSSVFARASAQIGAGVLVGVIGTVVLDRAAGRGPIHEGNAVVLLFVAVLMATVGLLAAIGPARRGLAVQPTEALREE